MQLASVAGYRVTAMRAAPAVTLKHLQPYVICGKTAVEISNARARRLLVCVLFVFEYFNRAAIGPDDYPDFCIAHAGSAGVGIGGSIKTGSATGALAGP